MKRRIISLLLVSVLSFFSFPASAKTQPLPGQQPKTATATKVKKITLRLNKSKMRVGESQRLYVTVSYSGRKPDISELSIKSTDTTIVRGINTGAQGFWLEAGREGLATISIELGGKSATKTVTVSGFAPKSVGLDKSEATLQKGSRIQLNATVYPAAANQKVTWKTSKGAVATVNKNGLVIAKKAGVATITVKTDNGLTYKCTITVQNEPVQPAFSDWSGWGAWKDGRESTSELKQEEVRYVYPYYYFRCPRCGAHLHVYNFCYTWAGGCGNNTMTTANWNEVWSTVSYAAAGLKDWHGTGRTYTFIDGSLVFRWPDANPKYQYRYRTRARIN